MNDMIWIDVTVTAAEEFVRQMAIQGYDATDVGGGMTKFEFSLNGRVNDKYAAYISYPRAYAKIGIRPDGK